MNKIIWVFGCSASGKETFIENILNKEDLEIRKVLNFERNRSYAVKTSIQLISKNKNDKIDYQRNLIIDEVVALNIKFKDSFFFIKGQNSDIRNNIIKKLVEKVPNAKYEIIFLSADLELLIERVKKKEWFNEKRGFDQYIESVDRTLGYMSLLEDYKITYVDSSNEYRIISNEEAKARCKKCYSMK